MSDYPTGSYGVRLDREATLFEPQGQISSWTTSVSRSIMHRILTNIAGLELLLITCKPGGAGSHPIGNDRRLKTIGSNVDMNDMKYIMVFSLSVLQPCLSVTVSAQDVIYPGGTSVESHYSLNPSQLAIGDTLTVQRTLINSSSHDLTGLYFSDCLPPSFELLGYTCRINSTVLTPGSSGPTPDDVVSGYSGYRWIIDSPYGSEDFHQTVAPGDTVVLELLVLPSQVGQFILPIHTAAFLLNNSGGFAMSQPVEVSVTITASVEENPEPGLLPSHFLAATAYPNPFNGAVHIYYAGKHLAGKRLSITVYNLLGQQVHADTTVAYGDDGRIGWFPDADVGSGIYLYKLSTGETEHSGKIVLVK